MARAAEKAAFRLDKRIVNSEGASISCQHSRYEMGNSAGFLAGQQSSRHYISCAVIAAEGELQAAEQLSLAADRITRSPGALQLRYLQTLTQIAGDKSSTIVFPLPIDIVSTMTGGAK